MSSESRWWRRLGRGRAQRPEVLRIEPLESERGFRLSGDLDLSTYTRLKEALEPELHGTVVLDLTALDFMDGDAGLGVLAWAIHNLGKQGGHLVLRNPSDAIRRGFEMTGLVTLPALKIEVDEGSA
jgi:anti-anti-sigma factor